MDGRCDSNGTGRHVGAGQQVVQVGHLADFLPLGQPATDLKVGRYDARRLLAVILQELVAEVQALAGEGGYRRGGGERGPGIHVGGRQQVLDPGQVVGFHRPQEAQGIHQGSAAALDGNFDVIADVLPDFFHQPHEVGQPLPGQVLAHHATRDCPRGPRGGIELEDGRTHFLVDVFHLPIGLQRADAVVEADPVPVLAAQQLVDGQARRFARQVPERRLDGAHRMHG